jgi:cytochrome c
MVIRGSTRHSRSSVSREKMNPSSFKSGIYTISVVISLTIAVGFFGTTKGAARSVQSPTADDELEPLFKNNVDSSSDIVQGKKVFSTCSGCHSDQAGVQDVGPSLFGVVGRKAGAVAGYQYSPAMKNSSVIWTAENLDKHLSNVKGFIPGNYMADQYPIGVPDPKDRAAVISYLESLK